MKRILLACAFLVGSFGAASATCSGPAVMHDFVGTAFNMSFATATDGNCASSMAPANPANWGIGAFGSAMPANGSATGLYDGTNLVRAKGDETSGQWVNIKSSVGIGVTGTFWQTTQPVSIATMPSTPVTGTFWQSTQPVSIATMPSTPVTGTFWQATQPVSASALPLPSGAATSANQSTEIASLGTIVTNTTGAATAANQTTANTSLAAIASAAAAAIPAQSNHTTNIGVVDVGHSLDASAPINTSTATTTQIVPLSGSTAIYVTSFDVMAGGTGNITFEYGTGTNCGTGTTVLTGAYPLTAQAGIAKGSGVGTVLKVPAGNALCVLTSAGVQMSGSLSYQQY